MEKSINANTQVYDKVIDRAAMIRLYERRVSGKVELVLDGHAVKIDKLIRDAELSQKGFERLREAVDQQLSSTYRETFSLTKRSLFDLVSDQVSYAYQNLETAIGKIWKTERPSKRVAEEIVLETPLHDDIRLEAGWSGIATGERKRLEAVIRKGISEGKTVDQIALEVRRGNVHNISRNQAKSLVVTAITSTVTQADHAVYKANEKALRGWQYVAVLDARTTPICAHRDGEIYPIGDKTHLPPAHFHCRSTTVPVFKSWQQMAELEGVAQVRRENLSNLSKKQVAFYDGQTPLRETYSDWLMRQPKEVQFRHLGDYKKVEMFNSGQLELSQFTNPEGNSIGIKELRRMTDSGYTLSGDTYKFAAAKRKLDAMRLWARTPEDFYSDGNLRKTLRDYYILQTRDLEGTLSLTNYRGTLVHTKKATKQRVLTSPPKEEQLKFNPITGRYEDTRLYQPNPFVLSNSLRLTDDSEVLLPRDKEFISGFVRDLEDSMSVNERAVVADNLRIMFTRFRTNGEQWNNFKAVVQGQIKFDVMNISDAIETQLRKDSDVLKKLTQDSYIDSVLGPTQLQELHDGFLSNIEARNKWEDKVAPKIARELRELFDIHIPVSLKYTPTGAPRLSENDLHQFYLRFAHRLSLSDTPDRDQFAVALGRDLYNLANMNGNRKKWYETGMKLLEANNVKHFFEVETFGVQKRRMKSRLSGSYFGPYYDTLSYNIRVTDPRIQEYARLSRKVELGLRVGVTRDKNRLVFRQGFKTYFIDKGALGLVDTRIPITSTSSFSDFPEEFVDKNLVNALNWAAKAEYKIDEDYYDFIKKLLYFEDDRGRAGYYNDLNEYRKYLVSRGDSYERLKAMEWLRKSGASFSNHPFIDHRARIYDRGLIGPQSGEMFRPFLNTKDSKDFGKEEFLNLQDQIGSFMGGLSDFLEGNYNSLTITGRQKIAAKWRGELIKIGNHMLRAKPADIRAILESEVVSQIDGEDLGKFYRLALESAKIDRYLEAKTLNTGIAKYSDKGLELLSGYKTSLALEQDASSSGAQIIALTTRNKQLAELSNVVPTTQKRRLYDEIAAATYNDPRFRKVNEKLGLTEKDLRKAAKAQNMVTFYGAGDRTGIINVEGKLGKILGKDGNTLVVTIADRDTVLSEISARIARYEKLDPTAAEDLRQLRDDVKDIFNKGIDPGLDILDQLYFLDPKTRELVERMSRSYDRVVTPDDFKTIANIMSEHLREQVPILKDFTRFFGRLAEEYLATAVPSKSAFDWKVIGKTALLGSRKQGYKLPEWMSNLLGIKANEAVSEKFIKRFAFWNPNSSLSDIIYGAKSPDNRRTGAKYFKVEIAQVKKLFEVTVLYANKLPKRWTNVPWVNFDGKVIEQNFTQVFEERLAYRDKDGNWVNNILQIPQKTEATWWEQVINASGKINDIADASKARTAFAVNGNHSNDAVIVKRFHLWGRANNISTSTIHDAFFANASDMIKARLALKEIYANALDKNVIIATLDEMLARGLPKAVYDRYLAEAIELGLIPIEGKSKIGGRVITRKDILTKEDILQRVPSGFKTDHGWYGVG